MEVKLRAVTVWKTSQEFLLGHKCPERKKIDRWSASLDAKPLNPEAADFVPERNPLAAVTAFPRSTAKAKIADEKRTANESSTRDVDSTVVLLKLTMLQAMQSVKFSGNPIDYPTFRARLRDNLEDEVLSDSQKLKFLPKFVIGEVYEVIERVAGCSYEAIMEILHERYGNPAAVAAACIGSLTNGPKITLDCETLPNNWRQPQRNSAAAMSKKRAPWQT